MSNEAFKTIAEFNLQDDGSVVLSGLYAGEFQPTQIKTHAMLESLKYHWPDLNATVEGRNTDGDRFRAIKDLQQLAHTDNKRFNFINEQLQKYEEANGMLSDLPRTEAQQDQYADYLILQLQETEPTQADHDRFAEAEAKRERRAERNRKIEAARQGQGTQA